MVQYHGIPKAISYLFFLYFWHKFSTILVIYWVTQKNVPCFLKIYIYRLNWDISNLFAVEDLLIHVLLLAKI